MIVFGSQRNNTVMGQIQYPCSRCRRQAYHTLVRSRRWFTLFFIPVIPIGKTTISHCNLCGYQTLIDNAQADAWFPEAQASLPGASQRGVDLRYDLTISFEEAVFGCQKEIELPRWETCPNCRGSGAQPGASTARCSACQGTGEIRRVQQSIFGQFVNVTMCERCRGEGRVITTPCEKCRGQGRVRNNRRVVVNIPAGVDDGIQVRVTGEGEVSARGGTPGNLYVILSVKPHHVFKRQSNDIIYELPISFTQAAL